MVAWKIKHIFNFTQDRPWAQGYFRFGFHGKKGDRYLLHWEQHWLGHLTADDRFTWTAGSVDKGLSQNHIEIDVKNPHYICESPDGALILSSNGNSKIYRIDPEKGTAELFIDAKAFGMKDYDCGNCVYDAEGNIWINDIRGCKVWKFDSNGRPLFSLGDGTPGFQAESVGFGKVRFNWIYDLSLGPDGNMYVLDSKSFAVRMIDLVQEVVTTVVGTGKPGYDGDGEDPLKATLGSSPKEYFDGPFSMSLDEEGNIFIGDTHNHVLRMVDRSANLISTLAGRPDSEPHKRNDPNENDPLRLNLPHIGSLDYYGGCLFIPEDDGDTIVLEKVQGV